ncbi:MAG: formimidoylglutamase [Brumimicrobium sp.]|nr:formimidoylglutamase [Brumimicrobium sp.]
MEESQSFEFVAWNNKQLLTLLSERDGETKIGQKLVTRNEAKYIIIGIEESIGPRANLGRGGAENGFSAFLGFFLNMQANSTMPTDGIHILGSVKCKQNLTSNLREKVEELDDFIVNLLREYVLEGQIPIVIGGGHNNAYPLIKFSFERWKQKINVINLDAHADYRLLEGRHSGNAFSYSFKDGFMNKYFVLGLHQRYNSQQILNDLQRDNHYYTFYEDYLMRQRDFFEDINQLQAQLNTSVPVGVELDMDTIEFMPSSAFSPVGISIDTGRFYVRTMAKIENCAYLHIPEGAPSDDFERRIVGKVLSYFVSDFIAVNQ